MTDANRDPEVRVMRYADGILSMTEREAFREELMRDPTLALRLEKYLFTQRIAETYDDILQDPVPAHLVATIMETGRTEPEPRPIRPFMYSRAVLKRLAGRYQIPVWSVAGAAALSLAGVVAAGLYAGGVLDASSPVAVAPLAHTLENNASNVVQTAEFKPFATFHSRDGGWCRLYEMQYSDRTSTGVATGLGCRTKDGPWRIHAQTPLRMGVVPVEAPSVQREAEIRKFAEEVKRITRGESLSQEEEAEALRGGWR